jgi:hypothetical protein
LKKIGVESCATPRDAANFELHFDVINAAP